MIKKTAAWVLLFCMLLGVYLIPETACAADIGAALTEGMTLQEDGTYLLEWRHEYDSRMHTLQLHYMPDTGLMEMRSDKDPYYEGGTVYSFATEEYYPGSGQPFTIRYYNDAHSIDMAVTINPNTFNPDPDLDFGGDGGIAVGYKAKETLQLWLDKIREACGLSPADMGFLIYEGYNGGDPDAGADDEITIPDTATDGAQKVIRYILSHLATDEAGNRCITDQLSVGSAYSDQKTLRIAYDNNTGTILFTAEWKMYDAQSDSNKLSMDYYVDSNTISRINYEDRAYTAINPADYRIGDDMFFTESDGDLYSGSAIVRSLTEQVLDKWNKMLGKGGCGLKNLGFAHIDQSDNPSNPGYEETELIRYIREKRTVQTFAQEGYDVYTITMTFVDDTDYDNEDKIILRSKLDLNAYALTYDAQKAKANKLALERNWGGEVFTYTETINPNTFTPDSDLVFHVPSNLDPNGLEFKDWDVAMRNFDKLLHENGFSLADLGLVAYENVLHGNPPEGISISDAKISSVKDQTYSGKAIKPKVTVKLNGHKLTAGTDYQLSYKSNKKIGTATITVTGIGSYTGTKEIKFRIVPKKVSITSLTAGKKQLIVKWKKGTGITGYEIQYGLKKSFKGAKTVQVDKAKTTSKVIKKLKKGKIYYVRIRAYKTVKGKQYRSAWSKAKQIEVN